MAKHSGWSEELERDLALPFPSKWIKQKRQGGSNISFVAVHLYVHRLNELVGPGWSMGEPILRDVAGKLVMGVPITIFGVTRINFGSEDGEHGNADEDGKVRDYGSAETNSFAQAFKRTCSLFGLGLSLYDKDGLMQLPPVRESEPDRTKALLDYITTHAKRVGKGAVLVIDGNERNFREYVQSNWPTIVSTPSVAEAVAKVVEKETNVNFGPEAGR